MFTQSIGYVLCSFVLFKRGYSYENQVIVAISIKVLVLVHGVLKVVLKVSFENFIYDVQFGL